MDFGHLNRQFETFLAVAFNFLKPGLKAFGHSEKVTYLGRTGGCPSVNPTRIDGVFGHTAGKFETRTLFVNSDSNRLSAIGPQLVAQRM